MAWAETQTAMFTSRYEQNSFVLKQNCCTVQPSQEKAMVDYATKVYGRSSEVSEIYASFDAGRDLSMAGPRRLGKTFVLDRLVDAAPGNGWIAVKAEVGGCSDPRAFFRVLCDRIGASRSVGRTFLSRLAQRLGQMIAPRSETAGEWYQPLTSLDHESYFERLIAALNSDQERRWVLLIDELPIFLKALHDQGPAGIVAARNFMNLTGRLRADSPRVRWMITGSIGLEPLARAGDYMGVLAKFEAFTLEPLTKEQAKTFVQDLARDGRLLHRRAITDAEAVALVAAVGWRSAYYLDALAAKLRGQPSEEGSDATQLVEEAVERLLAPGEAATFGVWDEHLRKHFRDDERSLAFTILAALAQQPSSLSLDTLLVGTRQKHGTRAELRRVLTRLYVEGFVIVSDWDGDNPRASFLNPLLRRWWKRFPPQAVA
jgi:uncharacterized protein